MCGKTEDLFIVEIEGSDLKVCKNCAKYGQIKKRVIVPIQGKKSFTSKNTSPHIESTKKEIIQKIVAGYGLKVKNAREHLNMKQEELGLKINEKESKIHYIETQRHEPSIKLARKLEKYLNIDLVEEYEEPKGNFKATESDQLTIGDMIKIKKK